jgi:hypothetical protein
MIGTEDVSVAFFSMSHEPEDLSRPEFFVDRFDEPLFSAFVR